MYSIAALAGAARAYPQSAYSALQRSVQHYLQSTTPNIESCCDLLDKAMREEFQPALFEEAIDDGDHLACLPHSSHLLPTHYAPHVDACATIFDSSEFLDTLLRF